MLWSDISELKRVLEVDVRDTSQDIKLNFINEWIGDWFGELLNRPGFELKQRTEYYDGTSTQKLLLRSRPVYTVQNGISVVPTVYLDEGGNFGSSSGAYTATGSQLVYGQDFSLFLDTDTNSDGTDDASRSGILWRINSYWPKRSVRQQGLLSPFLAQNPGILKISYLGGYSVDTMPAQLRMAADLLAAKLNYLLPLGLELGSESYEDRHISTLIRSKNWLLSLVWPMIMPFRNWKF